MPKKNSALEIARDLLRCASVTPADGGALGVLERLLKGAGFDVERVTFHEDGTEDIDNLFAKIGMGSPHICFAGHTDVVPAGDEAQWSLGPFAGDVKDGVLYGRGAVDMKGGIAAFAAAALDYLRDNGGKPKKGTISFLITGDEESIAVNGTVKLLKWAEVRGEKFDHCLLGEPTGVKDLGDCVKIGRRGSQNATLVVEGSAGHVAYPERANNPIPAAVAMIAALSAEKLDDGTPHFQPSNLEFTSVDVGNPTVNVIPGSVRAKFNIRYNDLHTNSSLRQLIEQHAAKAAQTHKVNWRIEWMPSNVEAFRTAPGAFTDTVVDAIREVTGLTPDLNTLGGTSDARFITNYCDVLEFGLVGQTMHGVDERTPVSDLDNLTKIYRKILDRYFA